VWNDREKRVLPEKMSGRSRRMCNDQQASDEHLREIAEKIREIARQTSIPQAKEELFDLADRIDRMAEVFKKTPG
jgi:hypothetical protein